MNRRMIGPVVIGLALFLLLGMITIPMLVIGGAELLFSSGASSNCGSANSAEQPTASAETANSVPSAALTWFQEVGLQYNVPWTILAGIGEVESNDGRTTLPGVSSGSNAFGAAGPLQIGSRSAASDHRGGHPPPPPPRG